jgi:NAD(P)-dependent dehydrogenase (short-subunit alcohol dehydrogenase family)
MSQKIAIITGANSGLGLHTAKKLFASGNYKLILACRDEIKSKAAIDEISNFAPTKNADSLKFLKLDLNNQKSIVSFVEEFKNNFDGLDILINNAGIMRHPPQLTKEGIEIHFASNHLGHYFLTEKLLDLFRPNGRIIIVSSGLYKNSTSIPSFEALTSLPTVEQTSPALHYSNSKLANCLHAVYLNQFFQSSFDDRLKSLKVVALRPGFVRGTELGRHVPWILRTLATPLIYFFSINLDQGIETIVHCATTEYSTLESGKLYSESKVAPYTEAVTLEAAEGLHELSEKFLEHGRNVAASNRDE